MDKVTTVTVVTVVYNACQSGREAFLRQCLESVAAQDYPGIEHLVIDGASTDGTLGILRRYEKAGSVKLISEPDTGIFNAMNKGLRHATGDYVAFLNCDDYYNDPQAVSKVVESLRRGTRDFTLAPCHLLDEDGSVTFSPLYLGRAFNVAPCYHPCVFARRSLLQSLGGFNERYRLAADSDLIARMILSGAKSAVIRTPFVVFRKGGASVDVDKCRSECIDYFTDVFGKYCGVSPEIAEQMVWSDLLPKKLLLKFLLRGDGCIARAMVRHRMCQTKTYRVLKGLKTTLRRVCGWPHRVACRFKDGVKSWIKSQIVRAMKKLHGFYKSQVGSDVAVASAAQSGQDGSSAQPLTRPHPLDSNTKIGKSTILLPPTTFINPTNNKITIGEDCILSNYFIFESGEGEIEIGNKVFINGQTQLISRNKITIEDNVTIAWGCMIYDHNSHSLDPLQRRKDIDDELRDFRECGNMLRTKDWSVVKSKSIRICRDAWLGFNVTVLAGSVIGEGAVVGAQSVVRGEIPPFAIAYGNPAKVVGYVRR